MENSKLMQLAKYEEMDGKEKKFEYFAEGPGAYWVGEGEKIKTSKPKWLNVTMTAKKIGVIIPVSREYLTYKMSDFFTQMQPKIAEAFYKKIDAATILDKENPFSQSIEKSVIAEKVNTIRMLSFLIVRIVQCYVKQVKKLVTQLNLFMIVSAILLMDYL